VVLRDEASLHSIVGNVSEQDTLKPEQSTRGEIEGSGTCAFPSLATSRNCPKLDSPQTPPSLSFSPTSFRTLLKAKILQNVMLPYSDECLHDQSKAKNDADYNVGTEAKTDA
jgi:hypothetical protein